MPFPLIPLIVAGISAAGSYFGARHQAKKNKELAQFQADANERYLDKQLEYNTPKNQMQRFQDAKLNPNLIYGQGNPGNQSAPLSYPDVRPADYQKGLDAFSSNLNQSMITQAQVQGMEFKNMKTISDIQLNKLQERVMARNPALNDDAYKAMIESLKSTAVLKQQTGKQMALDFQMSEVTYQHRANKVFQEVENLEKQFKLMDLDEKIKGEVLKSKEFQNAILEIQKRFIADGDIGPQQIMQFIMLLLTKSL